MADDESQSGNSEPRFGVVDLMKKITAAGIGAAFMTEESLRSFLGDMKLPKDVLQSLLQGAARSKEELMDRVGNELIKMIKKIDIVQEASRFVETHKFKVSAEIEILKRDEPTKDPTKEAAGPVAEPVSRSKIEIK